MDLARILGSPPAHAEVGLKGWNVLDAVDDGWMDRSWEMGEYKDWVENVQSLSPSSPALALTQAQWSTNEAKAIAKVRFRFRIQDHVIHILISRA